MSAAHFCCGCAPGCTIDSDDFEDDTITGWTTTGTWDEDGGLLEATGAGRATFDSAAASLNSPVRAYTEALNTSTDGTARLMICKSDDSNYLFGELAISGTAGNIRLGQVVGGNEEWLTEPTTVEDTDAELNARATLCIDYVPGETEEGESLI